MSSRLDWLGGGGMVGGTEMGWMCYDTSGFRQKS